MPFFNKTLLAMITLSLLYGCSAFDDDDDDDSAAKTSLSGKVADGYLAGAKVCLDINSNKVCDEGEPSTTSTAGGGFALEDVTQEQLDSAPLLVEVIVGETVDEDKPGVFIDKKYTLTAPAGYAFVSPLTTMVQSQIEDLGLSPDEAVGAVQNKLGTTLDLEADYVAGASSGENAEEFARLHKVAQVTVVVLQNNIELVEEVLDGAEVSFEDLLGLIVSQVLDALDTISTQVTAAGTDFDPTTVAESDEVSAANVDPATAKDAIAEREAARLTATANIAAVLANGDSLHFFESDESYINESYVNEYMYRSVSLGSNNTVSFTENIYNTTSKNWAASTDSDNDTDQTCVLTGGAWNCVDESSETIMIDGDTVILKVGNLEATRTEITGVSIDLSGKRIQSFLEDDEFLLVLDPTAKFTAGAMGYKLSNKRTQDVYSIDKDNVATATDCEYYEYDQATDVWCNNVYASTGDGNSNTDTHAATALSQLISATAAVNPAHREDIKGTYIYGDDIEIMAEFVTGGTANFYTFSHQQAQPAVMNKYVGSWKEEVVDSKTLLTFLIPPALLAKGDFDRDDYFQFFTVEAGYVRHGFLEKAGESRDNQWLFNNAGRDQVKAAFDYSLLADLAVCNSNDVDFDPNNLTVDPGATIAEFETAFNICNTENAADFGATELVGKTLVTDFGFLNFKANGQGVFLGEVGNRMNAVLDFTWAVNSEGFMVINTSDTEASSTVFLRLTFARIEMNARQISVKTFSQEASSLAGLDTVKGEISGEVWGVN